MRRLFFLFISFFIVIQLFGQGSNLITTGNNIQTCNGDTTVLKAVTGAIYTNYRWENTFNPGVTLSTDDSLVLTSISQFGEFYALLVDSNGITVDDTIFAIEFQKPAVNLGQDTIICSGDTITLQNLVANPAGATFNWNTGATSATIQVSNQGIYRLRVNAAFPNPCFGIDTVLVNNSPALKLQDQGEFNVCQGESLAISAILDSGGISPYVFQWSPPALFSNPNAQNTNLNTNTSTTISVSVTDRNGIGCTDSISFPVNVRPNVQANPAFSDSTICSDDSINLLVNPSSGTPGGGGYVFNWIGTNITNTTSSSPLVFPTQTSSYIGIVSDFFNCDDTAIVNIAIDSFGINIANGDSAFICSGQAVQISMNVRGGNGNETFQWSPDNGTVSNINIAEPTISGQGTYSVLASSSNGCIDSDDVVIGVAGLPLFSFDALSTEFCPSENVTISGQGSGGSGSDFKYIYRNGPTLLNTDSSQQYNAVASSFGTGTTITIFGSVIDGNACTSELDTLTFDVVDVPTTILSGDSVAYVNLTANFTLSGSETADSIFWDFGNGETQSGGVTQVVTYDIEGNFLIRTEVFFGTCLETNNLNVTVNPELTENVIYIPSAFSPNANNLENQSLKVYGENIVEEDFSFQVYSAWGDLIFESQDLTMIRNTGWIPAALSGTVLVVNCTGKFIDGEEFAVQQTVNFIQ